MTVTSSFASSHKLLLIDVKKTKRDLGVFVCVFFFCVKNVPQIAYQISQRHKSRFLIFKIVISE